MTEFITQVGKDIGYRLVFKTDDKDKFLYMQEQATRCIDNKHKEKSSRHGRWQHGVDGTAYAFCTACKTRMSAFLYGYAYCPHCGAKMDGEVE